MYNASNAKKDWENNIKIPWTQHGIHHPQAKVLKTKHIKTTNLQFSFWSLWNHHQCSTFPWVPKHNLETETTQLPLRFPDGSLHSGGFNLARKVVCSRKEDRKKVGATERKDTAGPTWCILLNHSNKSQMCLLDLCAHSKIQEIQNEAVPEKQVLANQPSHSTEQHL
jgi:hypothetical protein